MVAGNRVEVWRRSSLNKPVRSDVQSLLHRRNLMALVDLGEVIPYQNSGNFGHRHQLGKWSVQTLVCRVIVKLTLQQGGQVFCYMGQGNVKEPMARNGHVIGFCHLCSRCSSSEARQAIYNYDPAHLLYLPPVARTMRERKKRQLRIPRAGRYN